MHSTNSPEFTSRVIDDVTSSISLSSSVSDALAWLERSGQRAAVVMDGERPVGVITAIALHGRGPFALPSDACVKDVMNFEVVRVDPSFGVEDTLRTYRDAAWQSVRRRRPFAQHASPR